LETNLPKHTNSASLGHFNFAKRRPSALASNNAFQVP
jgi:hypothetical protein